MSFVKLDRKMLTWGWRDVPEVVALWVYILLRANYEANEWHGIKFEKGSFPTSINKLSEDTGLSQKQVRMCLEKLKKTGEIRVDSNNKFSKITVNKWSEYQCEGKQEDIQTAINGQTKDKQRATLKEIEEIKEPKKDKNNRPTVDDVRSYCLERKNGIDPERFWNYYESVGWKIGGKSPVRDWKACVRTWERKDNPRPVDTLPVYSTEKNTEMDGKEAEELLALMGKA